MALASQACKSARALLDLSETAEIVESAEKFVEAIRNEIIIIHTATNTLD